MITEKLMAFIFGVIIFASAVNTVIAFIAIGRARRAFARGGQGGPAGLWVRSAAYGIDSLLNYLLIFLGFLLAGWLESRRLVDGRVWYAAMLGIFFLPLVYFTIPYMRGKQTWGKKATGLTMEHAEGKPCEGWRALLRAGVQSIMSGLCGFLFVIADALTLALQTRKRALHDLAAGTRVRQTSPPPLLVAPAPLACGVVVVVTIVLLRASVMQTFFIPSESMNPSLLVNEKLIANKLCYRFGPVMRGDIIIFHPPRTYSPGSHKLEDADMTDDYYIKRVIALPGEKVHIVGNKGIFVNGKLLPDALPPPSDDWPLSAQGQPLPPYHLGAREVFVIGDNRDNSLDSRAWFNKEGKPAPGVPLNNIIGKASLLYMPLQRARAVK